MTKVDKIMEQYRLCGELRIDPFSVISGKLEVAEAKLRALIEDAVSVPAGKVLVPIDTLRNAADSLGSFCSDHGWSQNDMDNMDNLYAYIVAYDVKHQAMLSAAPDYEVMK